jgi:hypothetical protein
LNLQPMDIKCQDFSISQRNPTHKLMKTSFWRNV